MHSFAFPGNIETEILEIAALQVPYMRTRWFSELTLENENLLLDLLDCSNGRVIPYTAPGTLAMEAAVISYVSRHKMPLVLNSGTFGERWCQICRYHGLRHEEFRIPFGKTADMSDLASRIGSGKHDVLLMQHHETSSGQLHNLDVVSELCRTNHVSLVVDAISSFLADDFSMEHSGAQVVILSSQKGLNLPPGLSFVVLSGSAAKLTTYGRGSYGLDWKDHLDNLIRGQPPFSPATHLFMQLNLRLKKIREVGVGQVLRQVKVKADFFRDACAERGWTFSAEALSNCLTGLVLPFPVRDMVEHFNSQGIYVMPSMSDNTIRVAHTGTLGLKEHCNLIKEIEEWQMSKRP